MNTTATSFLVPFNDLWDGDYADGRWTRIRARLLLCTVPTFPRQITPDPNKLLTMLTCLGLETALLW
jgi:hypothetical protein